MKKSAYFALIALSLIILVPISLAQAYTNTQYNFSITPPIGWLEQEGTTIPVAFYGSADGASINVVSEPTNLGLMDYGTYAKNLQTQSTTFGTVELLNEGLVNIAGLSGYQLIYHVTQNDLDMKMLQVIFVEKGQAFIVTCGAFSSAYESYLPTFTQSIHSFRLVTNTTNSASSDSTYLAVIMVLIIVIVAILAVFFFRKMKQKPEAPQLSNSASFAPPTINVTVQAGSTARFCRFCGIENKPDTVFCESCGRKVDGT